MTQALPQVPNTTFVQPDPTNPTKPILAGDWEANNQIHTILMLQIRRRNVEAELERASARVAALAADIMKSDDNDDVVESHALEDCDAVEGHVNALQSELDALREDEAGLPTGDLDAIIAGLVNETHYLDEEQTLLQDRVTKADIAIMMGGFEAK